MNEPPATSATCKAEDVARKLAELGQRLVLAESCTAGLVSATLAQIAGISQYLCGSAVVYREATKQAWLSVAEADLESFTAVSEPVTQCMARAVLEKTPEADWAAAVTGHLGPDAPSDLDGVVFIAVARRQGRQMDVVSLNRHHLQASTRHARQIEATHLVLADLATALNVRFVSP